MDEEEDQREKITRSDVRRILKEAPHTQNPRVAAMSIRKLFRYWAGSNPYHPGLHETGRIIVKDGKIAGSTHDPEASENRPDYMAAGIAGVFRAPGSNADIRSGLLIFRPQTLGERFADALDQLVQENTWILGEDFGSYAARSASLDIRVTSCDDKPYFDLYFISSGSSQAQTEKGFEYAKNSLKNAGIQFKTGDAAQSSSPKLVQGQSLAGVITIDPTQEGLIEKLISALLNKRLAASLHEGEGEASGMEKKKKILAQIEHDFWGDITPEKVR